MDRRIIYTGSLPQDLDVLTPQENTMKALGMLIRATLGTGTYVDGLACTQTTVPSLSVTVAQGSMVSLQTVDTTAFGSLAADTTDPLMKMGINISSTTLGPMAAPTTAGQSVVYLVQAQFTEADGNAAVLSYYNSSNPSVPYLGANNLGVAQNTTRTQTVTLSLVQGAAATTGSQTTPAPTTGYTGLYAITIANGQTTITSANIATLATAPFIPFKLPNLTPGFGIVGDARNAAMSVTTASATATFTADQIIVGTALNGTQSLLASYSQTVNLATIGAGGMDTGTAPTSGFVALYAISGTAGTSILAVNATSAVAPSVYGGANMPAGYTASALISVWPTNASKQFIVGCQIGRNIAFAPVSVLSTTTSNVTIVSLNVASAIPPNAKYATISAQLTGTTATGTTIGFASSASSIGNLYIAGWPVTVLTSNSTIQIITPQTIYYSDSVNAGSIAGFNVQICGYSI